MVLYRIINAIDLPINMLTLSGAWPFENNSLWYLLRKIMSYGGTMLICVLMIIEISISLQDIVNLSNILLLGFEYFAYAVKLFVFHFKRNKIHSLSQKIQDPLLNSYDERHNEFVQNSIRRSNFIGNTYKFSCLLAISVLALRPFIEDAIFPVPFSFFQEGFKWYIIYFVQVSGVGIGIWNNAAIDSLCIGYMGIALAEFEILIYNIKNANINLTEENDSDFAVESYLSACSKHHNKIIEFVKNIEDVISMTVLVQYFSSVVVICNSGFRLIMTPLVSGQFLTLIVYFTAVMIELFMYCYVGNEIILKSLEVGNACFMSEWYQFSPRINKILFLIMERSKRPVTISAYKLSVLSLSAYIKIIQWSYSYFTVLRRVYMKD